jgi:hypothetical protein
MQDRKREARLFGLLIATALGALAFAASAQAVAPGFLINGKPVGTLLAIAEAVQEGTGTLLVSALNFKLSCTTVTVDEGEVTSNTDAKMIVLNTGCTALTINTSAEIDCHITEPIKVEALLLPAELTNGEPAVLAEKIKGVIEFHLKGTPLLKEKACVLPLTNNLSGETCSAIKSNDTVEPLAVSGSSIECKERTALESLTEGAGVKDVLKYGAQTAISDGASILSLTGPHKGMTMGVSLY